MKSLFCTLLIVPLLAPLFAQIPVGYKLETVPLPKGAVTVL